MTHYVLDAAFRGGQSRAVNVHIGLSELLDNPSILRGERVGLVVNPISVTPAFVHAIDAFANHPKINLTAIFGPEHGARGEAQYMVHVGEERDARTGLPVFSLYGATEESLRPTHAMLDLVDVLVVDLQDVGSRYYTYIYTMAYCMEAAARVGKRVVVLDRPNPLGGTIVEGNVLHPEMASFVGRFPLAVRHGMTAGELARYFNDEIGIGCELDVVHMQGWTRGMWFDDTELPWVIPSPNMPTLDTATVYPGGCLMEGTNLSEGRGTTRPFEFTGAPWIDHIAWVKALERLDLPGVRFRPHTFQPTFDKWVGRSCSGFQIHITDRERFKPFLTGIAVIQTARTLAPRDFDWRREPYEFVSDRLAIDLLLGDEKLRPMIESGATPHEIELSWGDELQAFRVQRAPYLIYED